jgi:hypothetical protein
MYNITLGSAILSSLLMISLILSPMARQHQAFAQNSTMTMNLAKLLANDAIQALNHKDINGALEHLRLIGQELGISGNSTSTHSPLALNTSKAGRLNLMNTSSGVVVRLK